MEKNKWDTYKPILLELFVLANFIFLILDIFLAHSVNRFRHWAEWIPFYFSIVAALLLFVTLVFRLRTGRSVLHKKIGYLIGFCSILVGISGFIYHLESQFFSQWTIKSLVYTAPFVAPLAYAGLGFLLLLNRMVSSREKQWGLWIIFLALGGFFGNFVLSLCDHAQNGFFHWLEWIPICASAFAVGFLTIALFEKHGSYLKICLGVIAIQAVVGFLGFYFHLMADINGISSSAYENFVHGAPVFAPLLFVNLALLALLGIWDVKQATEKVY